MKFFIALASAIGMIVFSLTGLTKTEVVEKPVIVEKIIEKPVIQKKIIRIPKRENQDVQSYLNKYPIPEDVKWLLINEVDEGNLTHVSKRVLKYGVLYDYHQYDLFFDKQSDNPWRLAWN
jgi:hypothetical protein